MCWLQSQAGAAALARLSQLVSVVWQRLVRVGVEGHQAVTSAEVVTMRCVLKAVCAGVCV